MPWSTNDVEAERKLLIKAWLTQRYSVVELARKFGISERIAHLTIVQFKSDGLGGLKRKSRARLTQSSSTESALVERIVELRRHRPTWGPRKLRDLLRRTEPSIAWPASSTIGDILKREGLISPRHRRRRRSDPMWPSIQADAPNASWSMDHKGHFAVGGGRCYPFTVTDNFSRMILCCDVATSAALGPVWSALRTTFRERGLPRSIRSDNGSPFAGNGLTRLSTLSVRLIRLGITPEFITPGKPQQNGRHERMHRTLKQETASPPAATLRAQQRRFDGFVADFNTVRPHEALQGQVPADVHVDSTQEMPSKLPKIEYDDGVITRAVNAGGCFKWASRFVFLAEPLVGERVAFDRIDDGIYTVRFGPRPIAVFDEVAGKVYAAGNRDVPQPLNYVPGLKAEL